MVSGVPCSNRRGTWVYAIVLGRRGGRAEATARYVGLSAGDYLCRYGEMGGLIFDNGHALSVKAISVVLLIWSQLLDLIQ